MSSTKTTNAPLAAIRIMLHDLKISLVPLTHQINALPNDSDLEYYFVPVEHSHYFKPYYRPGQPFKNFKLVNYERPAISLNFFIKHKYNLDKDISPQRALEYLQEHRDQLYNRTFFDSLSSAGQKELQETDALLRAIREQPDNYDLCFSNYHNYYKYWYCSFRYFEDDERTKAGTDNEHLLKHSERVEGKVNERMNVIFIDPEYITRPVPYDNKLADRELATYPKSFGHGKISLYVREK